MISFLIALPSYAFLILTRNRSLNEVQFYAYAQYVLAVFIGLLILFEIHHLKSRFLEQKLSWKAHFRKRMVLELLLAFLLSPPIVTGTYASLYLLVWKMPLFGPSIVLYNGLGIFISLLFMGFVNTQYILFNWQQSIFQAETLKKERVQAQLSELQNQISPHFLFNHFNILYSLIDEDKEEAKLFLNQLAEIYRYVLSQKDEELVSLAKELEFLKRYIFLIKTRFDQKVDIELQIQEKVNQYKVPPLCLQILLENAIKHNEASKERPLKIRIQQTNEYLIFSNTYQPRASKLPGTQTGLSNIRKRIKLLTDTPLVIKEESDQFIVHLPLLYINPEN